MDNIFVWNGSNHMYLDEMVIKDFKGVTYGLFGGASSSGALYNEDGLIILKPDDQSTLVILFDAHTSNESVTLVQRELLKHQDHLESLCQLEVEEAIPRLQEWVVSFIQTPDITQSCETIKGETAVLFCYQKDEFIWWLSIGDNSLYVFHKEFNELGQYRLNQRIFYQWIGKANALSLKVPCYQSGTLQLREGENKILLLTDGILEIKDRPYEDDQVLAKCFEGDVKKGINTLLTTVQSAEGRDSCTAASWSVSCHHLPLRPTR